MLAAKMLLFSLILVGTFYHTTTATWRSVTDARVETSDDNAFSSGSTYSSITDVDSCNSTCRSGTTDIDCKSFVFGSDSGCTIYNTRFGFDGTILLPSTEDTSVYYERPTDEIDTLGDQIQSRIDDVGYESFLAWFRQAQSGQVNIDDTSLSDLELLVEISGVSGPEECAKLCLRSRGVIDETVGTRCDSFNYRTGICQLLSISWDDTHDLVTIDSATWDYYDRLQGSGCWITQEDCRANSNFEGTIEVTTDENGASIEWEYQCMAQAKEYHENVCDGYVTKATIVYWGGTDGQGVFDSWNSWDFTTGCVIDLNGDCYPNGGNQTSRFSGKFRDSIAEDQFNAANNVDSCFERAVIWQDYCNLPGDQAINISYPSTGAVYIYPLINCTCNENGMKTDPASQLQFCTRNNTETDCWRENQQDFWSYQDIICSDLPGGACPDFDANDWEATDTYCWLDSFECASRPNGDQYDYIGGTFQVPCDSNDGEYYLPVDTLCAEWSEETCTEVGQIYHELCANDISDGREQAVTFYMQTGNMYVYPSFEDPAEETLMLGIDPILGYTKSDNSSYGSVAIGTGRWMAVENQGNAYNIRQITIWFENDEEVSLTMSLYRGEGITGSVKLETTSIGTFGPTESGGEYIHFEIDILMESDTWYTWQVTSTEGNTNDGFIGFGLDYSNGYGDLNWDYAFVIWVENENSVAGQLQLFESVPKEDEPLFEIIFILLLCCFVVWVCVLIGCHFKRIHDQKVEKREERERQREIKQRARQKALARNDAEAEFYGDDDQKDGRVGLLDSDDEDDDDDDDFGGNGRTINATNNKQAVIEEEDDDDDVVVTKGGQF